MLFRNQTRGVTLAADGEVARSFPARALGLMFRARFPAGQGLFISPCDSIHMMFVFFPIDVAFVDRDYKVVRIRHRVQPFWFAMGGPGAWSVFELPVGTLAATGTQEGDVLEIAKTLG